MSTAALRQVRGSDMSPGDMIFCGDDSKCPTWYALVIAIGPPDSPGDSRRPALVLWTSAGLPMSLESMYALIDQQYDIVNGEGNGEEPQAG